MYRYIEERNYADTSRDPDIIIRSNEKFFKTLKEAKDYAKKKFARFFEPTIIFKYKGNFKYNKNTKEWYFCFFGTWTPVIYIKRINYEK